jgi:antitoxin component of MazEF toxin-antitoxin module
MSTIVKADATGAVTLPPELCRAAGVAPGTDLVAEVQAGRIVLESARLPLAERIVARACALPADALGGLPDDLAAQRPVRVPARQGLQPDRLPVDDRASSVGPLQSVDERSPFHPHLELAVQYGSPVFLPYFLLAHHYLVTRRFQDCLAKCDQASQLQPPAGLHSELAEWTAVAQAELGFPAESVRASLEKALRLDPSNDRARRNLDQFETALRSARAAAWDTRSAAAVRTSGQAERQLSMAA